MSTKRESILAAAKSALTSITGVSESAIYRSRVSAFGRAEFPAIVIEPVSDVADNPATSRAEWDLTFQIAVLVRASIADQNADAIVEQAHAKIMQSATLDALVTNLVPVSVEWQLIEADVPLGVITMQFMASYQTALNSISA